MVDRLGSEFERWQQQMQSLQSELSGLDLNCALAAASVTYLGVEAYDKRQQLANDWLKLCRFEKFDVVSFLALEVEQVKASKQDSKFSNLPAKMEDVDSPEHQDGIWKCLHFVQHCRDTFYNRRRWRNCWVLASIS